MIDLLFRHASIRPVASLLSSAAICLILVFCIGCGETGDQGEDTFQGGRSLIFSVRDAAGGQEPSCLSLAGAVTIHIVPGPDYGPFWRDAGTGSLEIPSLSVPVGDLGTAIVDVHILGYMAAAPPPSGLPICSGSAYGLELFQGRSSAVNVDMACTDNDGDGLLDTEEDCNHNGRMDTDAPNCQEGTLYETDPAREDTDGGGILDGDERAHLTDPLDPEDDLAIFGIFPRVVYPGDRVVISGRGFSRNLYENEVRFGTTIAQNVVVDAQLRYLTVEVPDTVQPGDELFLQVTLERTGLVSDPLYCIPGGSPLATVPVGDAPDNIRFSPDGSRIYVVNRDSRDLSVVDPVSLREVTGPGGTERIPLGEGPQAMDLSGDGSVLYVLNRLSQDVTPVNTLALSVAGPPIPVGPDPWEVLMIPGGQKAYVLNHGAHAVGCISVLDTVVHEVLDEIDFAFDLVTSARGIDMGLNHDGSRVWLSHAPEEHIYKIDTSNEEVRWSETVLSVGLEGMLFQFSPDGRFAYVVGPGMTPAGCGMMNEIPTNEPFLYMQEDYPVCLPVISSDAVLSVNGEKLYVSSSFESDADQVGAVSAVDLTSRTQHSIHMTFSASDLSLSPDGSRLYLSDVLRDTIHVLDTAAETSLAEVSLDGDMRFEDGYGLHHDDYWRQLHRNRISLSPDGSRLATANEGSHDVSVLAVADPTPFHLERVEVEPSLINQLEMCCDPKVVAFHPDRPRAYATSDGSHNLAVIDTRSHRVIQRIDFTPFIPLEAGDDPHAPAVSKVLVSAEEDAVFVFVYMDPYALVKNPARIHVFKIDAAREAVVDEYETDIQIRFENPLVLRPGGDKLYMLSRAPAEVQVLEAATLVPVDTVPVDASQILFHPTDSSLGYLTRSGGVVLFNPENDTLIDADGDPETTGPGLPPGVSQIVSGTEETPWQPCLSPDGKTLYAIDGIRSRERVLVMDLERRVLSTSFLPQGRVNHLVPGPLGRKLYVLVGGAPEVQVYDTRHFQLIHRIPVGNDTAHPVLSPDGSRLYLIADYRLYVIDTTSDQVVSQVPVARYGKLIQELVVSGDGSLAYIPFNPFIGYPSDAEAGIDVVRIPAPLDFSPQK